MTCEIISSVMSQAHIDELIRLSKTKKSHIGTNYKKLNVYGVTPKGVLFQVNEKICGLQLAYWKQFPPTQEEILESVDYLCTDTGKGGNITNYELEYYPYIVEYFVNRGLRYNVLEKITKPDGTECVTLNVGSKIQKFISNSGILTTTIKGYRYELEKIIDYLKKYGNHVPFNRNLSVMELNINIETPFWQYNKQKIASLHHKLLEKVITCEFKATITSFMKYQNLNEEQSDKLAECYTAANNDKERDKKLDKESVKRFIQFGNWANVISVYCYKRLNSIIT